MRRLYLLFMLSMCFFVPSYAHAQWQNDNFNDNTMDTNLWQGFSMDPFNVVNLSESSQQLEFTTAGWTPALDGAAAAYISKWNFLINDTDDFEFHIDYSLDGYSGNGVRAIGMGLTNISKGVVAIGLLASNNYGLNHYHFYGRKDSGDINIMEDRTSTNGRLYGYYNAADDELTFSAQEYIGSDWETVTSDTIKYEGLRSNLGLDKAGVILAGLSTGAPSFSSEAYLDNFSVSYGVTPEPVSSVLFVIGSVPFGMKLFRKKQKV